MSRSGLPRTMLFHWSAEKVVGWTVTETVVPPTFTLDGQDRSALGPPSAGGLARAHDGDLRAFVLRLPAPATRP